MKINILPVVPKPSVLLLPLAGMGLFVVLYILAALNYPGGSWVVMDQEGFNFWNNYLCDLLDRNAINGEINPARFFARGSLGVLCVSLILLWYFLPGLFSKKGVNVVVMWLAGLLALVITMSLTSGTHDITVRIAGVFGVIAFISCFIELYKAKYFSLVYFGIACLIIFLVNYYIYETGTFIRSLPVIQKVTFICFILWFSFLDISFYKYLKHKNEKIRMSH
ncbi:hypothetical protein [uncultured Eudoraea sp.]|uniref:hypothetical protein n=1 Tax=uncultured Eudoraea sp. TaxID=1035614 RepID=UPI0026274C6F|nr:hypothetical protein [uncultured Eudoraea sp.]